MTGIRIPMKPRMKKKTARTRFHTLFRRTRDVRGISRGASFVEGRAGIATYSSESPGSGRAAPSSGGAFGGFLRRSRSENRFPGPYGRFPSLHSQTVVHVAHAADRVGQILGEPLGAPVVDGAFEGHLSAGDLHRNVGGVDLSVLFEPLVDFFPDPLVPADVAFRAAAGERPADRLPRDLPAPPSGARFGLGGSRVGIDELPVIALSGVEDVARTRPVVIRPGEDLLSLLTSPASALRFVEAAPITKLPRLAVLVARAVVCIELRAFPLARQLVVPVDHDFLRPRGKNCNSHASACSHAELARCCLRELRREDAGGSELWFGLSRLPVAQRPPEPKAGSPYGNRTRISALRGPR